MDMRVSRTRHLILNAFTRLALDRRYDRIRTADLVAESGVGRSTFYEHFRSKDDVLLATMEPILLSLAGAAVGRASKAQVRATLEHMWTERSLGRVILASRASQSLQRQLASMIEKRLPEDQPTAVARSMIANGTAASQLAMLRMWFAGEASCSADALAGQLTAQPG
jgi:AcrR family transcriptional regulator